MTSDEKRSDDNTEEPKPSGTGNEKSAAHQEEQPGPQAEPEAAEASAEEEAEAPKEPPRPLDVYTVLRVSIAQLAGIAWQTMGLQADPFTNQLRKDIKQARVAIDATAVLVEELRPHLQGQEARDYDSLLTDLRLNFVKQSSEEEKTE